MNYCLCSKLGSPDPNSVAIFGTVQTLMPFWKMRHVTGLAPTKFMVCMCVAG